MSDSCENELCLGREALKRQDLAGASRHFCRTYVLGHGLFSAFYSSPKSVVARVGEEKHKRNHYTTHIHSGTFARGQLR
jgi:hypothetical protein